MMKCYECGHTFLDGDEAHWTEETGEPWSGCPVCRGDYDVADYCGQCGESFHKENLYGKYCLQCLMDKITYENALNYLISRNQLVEFFFESVYEIPQYRLCDDCKKEMAEDLTLIFWRRANAEKEMISKCFEVCTIPGFLYTIKAYIAGSWKIDDDSVDHSALDDFAYWLESHEKTKTEIMEVSNDREGIPSK